MKVTKEHEVTHKEFYDERYKKKVPFAGMLEVSKRVKLAQVLHDIRSLVDKGERVIDVGCGNGRFASALSRYYKVSASDSAEQTMSTNQKEFPNVEFFSQDLTATPLDPRLKSVFKAATCIDVIEHVPFSLHSQLIQNLAEMLEDRGILILTTPDRDVSLTFKRDQSVSDEEFLQLRERQPRADQLTSAQLDALIKPHFKVICSFNLVPAVHSRFLDLIWKTLLLPIGYRGAERLRKLFSVPGQYHYRVLEKRQG